MHKYNYNLIIIKGLYPKYLLVPIFLVEQPSSAKTLMISFIGMKTVEVSVARTVSVVLKADAEVLDEVMVVAFGTAKKSAFTGAAAVVDNKELSKHITTNVTDALAGSVPGLQIRGNSGQPGSGSSSINIRGIASMYAETDPLVIVDGAPYTASLSNIPQSDIESISVLKDAASAALYGARGAAGVILITTKKAKTQTAVVSLDMKWGSNSRAVQEYDVIDNPAQFYEAYYSQVYNYYTNNGYAESAANIAANNKMLTDLGYNVYTVPEGQYLIGTNGKLNPNATIGRQYTYNGETYYMQPDNWTDAAYNNALRQEYNISVSASNDRANFYASLGYLNEDGIIEYSGYERISARVKADYQAKKWLKFGANIGFVNSAQESNPNMDTSYGSTNLMYYTSMIAPIYPIYVYTVDANGNPVVRTDANGNPQYDYGVAAKNYGVGRGFLQTGNPLGSNRYNKDTNDGNQFNGTFTMDANITEFLRFNVTSNVIWGRNMQSDYQNALYGPKEGVNGELKKEQTDIMRQNHTQTLTYFDQFGKHNINVLIGHEYYDTKTTYLSATAQGIYSSDIKEIDASANKTTSSSYTTEYNVEGYFGSLQYNYDDKYFGSASYRRDASSRFAKANRWGNFWSVGGAWLLNKENFLSDVAWIDQLKLKASIGQQGNDNIGNWAYIDLYSLTPSSSTNMSATFYRIGNSDITWETTTNFNGGFEFSFWKGRLAGNVDFYTKKTTDLLFWLSVPEAMGSRGYYGNVGDIRNTGVELQLTGSVIRTKNIDWSISANISHNKTKILKLPEAKTKDYGGFYESSYWYTEGGEMYNFMTYAYAGVDQETGEALYYYDEDLSTLGGQSTNNVSRPGTKKSGTTKKIGEASRYANGSILPKAYGGFSTTVKLWDFDISATFDYQLGGKVYDSRYAALMAPATSSSDGGQTYHVDIFNSWTPTNTSSNIPRWQYADDYTFYGDRALTNASYLNFQSFTVGYSVPKTAIKALGLSSLRIYAAGENLCFWSKRKGLDPRYSYDGNESVAVYSPVRTIMGGIQVSF